MSARRLLHVVKATGVAGAETHLLILLEGLRAAGLDAELLILAEPAKPVEAFFTRAAARGIPAHCLAIRRRLDRGLFHNLQQFFREGGYKVVHTHLIHADVHGIPAARRAGVPHVVSTRHADNPFRRRLPLRLAHRWLWRRVDRGIAISEAVRRFCIEVEGAPPHKMTTVHYGLDPDTVQVGKGARNMLAAEMGIPASAPLVGSVCRLIEVKGIAHALRAFWQLAEAFPKAHYAIAGEGPLRRELETAARGFGLEGRVHFLGWRDDPHQVIAGLDVLLAPSLQEGFGLVLLEAMALRVPVIASRVSAMPEIVVDGETGLLTEPGDADGIASALSTLLANPDVAREMGANGRARLEAQFTAQRMVERTCAVYESLDAGR
ncbi:MAG: glycosyltransferase [Anaerolineae bacterium]